MKNELKQLEAVITHRGEDYAKVVVDGVEYELSVRETETISMLIDVIKNIVRGK